MRITTNSFFGISVSEWDFGQMASNSISNSFLEDYLETSLDSNTTVSEYWRQPEFLLS